MVPRDAELLRKMSEAIHAYRSRAIEIGELADRLLTLCDRLQFRNHHWEHELTQQIATLDSASTFTPKDEEQANQMSCAIGVAVDALLRLIKRASSHDVQ